MDSYTPTKEDQKEKLGNNPTYHHIKKNKISRKKHTQEDKRAVLQKL